MSRAPATILAADDLEPAVNALIQNEVVGIPTETVYGLAGNAFDDTAVTKIFAAKERPSFDPLIVHIAEDLSTIAKLASAQIVNSDAMSKNMIATFDSLARSFWPGPLTMIVPKHKKIPDLVTSGLDRVGVRMPAHPVTQSILKKCNLPLAAPSANRFGRISPTTASAVQEELGDRIPYIVDGGRCEIGVESTVVALDDGKLWLLRPGKISANDLAKVINIPVVRAPTIHEKASPGMLASHYAPKKPMFIISDFETFPRSLADRTFALLITSGDGVNEVEKLAQLNLNPVKVVRLSISADPAEAAKELFAAMRALDKSPSDIILATPVPSTDGLWLAIQDRMLRASTPL